jgi:hypothetical protein
MKGFRKHFRKFLIMGFALYCLNGCKSSTGPGSDIQIQWLSTTGLTVLTYSYSGGVPSGANVYQYFEVLEGSGETRIEAKLSGSEKSVDTDVSEGKSYKVRVSVGLSYNSAAGSTTTYTLKLSTPSSNEERKINLVGEIKNLSLKNIEISEWSQD